MPSSLARSLLLRVVVLLIWLTLLALPLVRAIMVVTPKIRTARRHLKQAMEAAGIPTKGLIIEVLPKGRLSLSASDGAPVDVPSRLVRDTLFTPQTGETGKILQALGFRMTF